MEMTATKTFQLEEYKALRKEIEIYVTELKALERYTIIGLGVMWGWLIANHRTHWLLWSVPIAFTLAAEGMAVASNHHFRKMSEYISKTETAFGVCGWEHHVLRRNRIFLWVHNIILIMLIALAIGGWWMRTELAK